MEVIAITINGLLALIALWYTIETRKLRLQNQAQLNLLAKQVRAPLAPYLHVNLLDEKTALHIFEEDGAIPKEDSERQKFLNGIHKRFSNPGVKFICRIDNKSDKLAVDMRVYVFEGESGMFLRSAWGRTILEGKATEELDIFQAAVPLDVIKEEMLEKYGEVNEFFSRHLDATCKHSYVVVFFKDIEGGPYVVRREFEKDKEGIITPKLNAFMIHKNLQE